MKVKCQLSKHGRRGKRVFVGRLWHVVGSFETCHLDPAKGLGMREKRESPSILITYSSNAFMLIHSGHSVEQAAAGGGMARGGSRPPCLGHHHFCLAYCNPSFGRWPPFFSRSQFRVTVRVTSPHALPYAVKRLPKTPTQIDWIPRPQWLPFGPEANYNVQKIPKGINKIKNRKKYVYPTARFRQCFLGYVMQLFKVKEVGNRHQAMRLSAQNVKIY